MKPFLWLILFPPVGIYLLLKGKKNNPSERTETPPAEKPNTVKTEKKSEEQFTEPKVGPQDDGFKENYDYSILSSEDLEMMTLAVIAFWGDGQISKSEFDFLKESCERRLDKLVLVDLTDPRDIELSAKEYLIYLFEMINDISSNGEQYSQIEIPKKFRKKKGKKYIPTLQHKIFYMLLDELEQSYSDDANDVQSRMTEEEYDDLDDVAKQEIDRKIQQQLENPPKKASARFESLVQEARKLAKIDGLSPDEKDLLSLLGTKQKRSLWLFFIIIIALVIYIFNY